MISNDHPHMTCGRVLVIYRSRPSQYHINKQGHSSTDSIILSLAVSEAGGAPSCGSQRLLLHILRSTANDRRILSREISANLHHTHTHTVYHLLMKFKIVLNSVLKRVESVFS